MFFFLPLTIIAYFFLNQQKYTLAATSLLVFVSLLFYSWWNIKYLALIIGSIIFNFAIGTALGKMASNENDSLSMKAILIFGIVSNVILLGYYKYADFFITNLYVLTGWQIGMQKIILPLGISFFTFTQIAYLVDAWSGKAKEYDFLNYSLFVTFFPHLLAGPIIHHKEMMPQFNSMRNKILNYRHFAQGIYLFSIGLFKKVIIADTLAPVANAGFDTVQTLTLIEAWVASLSYTLQLYFDFSAYTDMALGSALMFNIRLPINFNSPYKALNIADFWRRWHATLSRFLRDYIYIPLGGNREGSASTYWNIMTVFLIGGIWHGAGWTFIFWGFLHGAATIMHRIWTRFHIPMHRAIAWFLTFNFVNIAWVFFRAKTWDDAQKVLSGMFGLNGVMLSHGSATKVGFLQEYGVVFGELFYKPINNKAMLLIALFLAAALIAKNSDEMTRKFTPNWQTAAFASGIAIYALLDMNKITEFLYFNF